MGHTRDTKNASAISSFAGTVKFFVVMTVKLVKYTLLPLLVAYRIVRMFVSLSTLLVLLTVGGGLLMMGGLPLGGGEVAAATEAANAAGTASSTGASADLGSLTDLLPY